MAHSRDLVPDRVLKAPRTTIWRRRSEPALLERWFRPAPWRCAKAEMELRPGGRFHTAMAGPNGEESDNSSVFLDVAAGERLVFTDAYVTAWEPSHKPLMTVTITLADAPGGACYLARAAHWLDEDRTAHREMGFEQGWGKAADRLEALAASR